MTVEQNTLPMRFDLVLPSGEIIREYRKDAFVLSGNYFRYERRDGRIYVASYRMEETDDPARFLLTEVYAEPFDGVL